MPKAHTAMGLLSRRRIINRSEKLVRLDDLTVPAPNKAMKTLEMALKLTARCTDLPTLQIWQWTVSPLFGDKRLDGIPMPPIKIAAECTADRPAMQENWTWDYACVPSLEVIRKEFAENHFSIHSWIESAPSRGLTQPSWGAQQRWFQMQQVIELDLEVLA